MKICYYLSIEKVREVFAMIVPVISVIMIFGIPIIAILTSHFQKQTKMKAEMIKDELELEKLKHQNYLIETEKMKLELEKIALNQPKDEIRF